VREQYPGWLLAGWLAGRGRSGSARKGGAKGLARRTSFAVQNCWKVNVFAYIYRHFTRMFCIVGTRNSPVLFHVPYIALSSNGTTVCCSQPASLFETKAHQVESWLKRCADQSLCYNVSFWYWKHWWRKMSKQMNRKDQGRYRLRTRIIQRSHARALSNEIWTCRSVTIEMSLIIVGFR
jgi:hypothetical protein